MCDKDAAQRPGEELHREAHPGGAVLAACGHPPVAAEEGGGGHLDAHRHVGGAHGQRRQRVSRSGNKTTTTIGLHGKRAVELQQQ